MSLQRWFNKARIETICFDWGGAKAPNQEGKEKGLRHDVLID